MTPPPPQSFPWTADKMGFFTPTLPMALNHCYIDYFDGYLLTERRDKDNNNNNNNNNNISARLQWNVQNDHRQRS